LNTKKCLITIVLAISIAAVMQAQETSEDLTAEKRQLAQEKADLDAREKALAEREKRLAQRERAAANSTSRSREKEKAKAKQQEATAKSKEEQAKTARAEKKLHEPFFQRLDEAFLEQLGMPAYTPPDPNAPNPRRIPPAPFDSPPFPSADWQIGGTQIIGDPGELPPYPLMQAIYEGPYGQAWKDSKVQIYGWLNFSGNISTSHPSKTSENGNFPLIYDLRPNRMELNQIVLYLERLPDENQTDHIDWGFRFSALYGLDYRFTTTYGWLSDQLLKHNSYSGIDMPMVYLDLYIPWVFQGMNIRIGRIISEPDIEAQLAPNNLMATHSLLYSFDDYCHEGIFTTTKINDQWTIQAGIDDGTDVAIWQKDPGRQVTGTIMIQYTTPNQMDSTTPNSATTICNNILGPGRISLTTRSTAPLKRGTCSWRTPSIIRLTKCRSRTDHFRCAMAMRPNGQWSIIRCFESRPARFSLCGTNISRTRLGAGLVSLRTILNIRLGSPGGQISSLLFVLSFGMTTLTL
jgi:hypothetical protein